jgi:Uma2 family endonuclease
MEMILELEPPFLVIKPDLGEADFYRLAGEDSDWEYIDGRVVMHSPASDRHEDLFRFLFVIVGYFLSKKGGGILRGSRFPMRLDPAWSPEPDLLVVRDERRHLITKQRLEGPADMVIEIASEADSHLIYREKLPRYRDAGIPEIWIIDPARGEVLADRAAGPGREQSAIKSGRLASAVLPGFWIDVGWLWHEGQEGEAELPPPHTCLEEILGSQG